jgi:hypothetical protein
MNDGFDGHGDDSLIDFVGGSRRDEGQDTPLSHY